jgi:putative flippase GtrA
MAGVPTKISKAAWHLLPAPVRRKLRSESGMRFMRFVPVSLAALASSQIALAVLVGVVGMSAGSAAFIASAIGAGVSYVLSRWAWERKGRPDLLRETLPFWVVSIAAWTFLSFASHEASLWSKHMGHSHWEHVAVVNGAYFLANCFTFVARFAIFHYILFANRGDKARAAQVLSVSQQVAEAEPGHPDPAQDGSGPGESAQPDSARRESARREPTQRAQDDEPVSFGLAAERRAEPPARR